MSRPRCRASWDGARCTRPAGHGGQHEAAEGMTELRWSDVPAAAAGQDALWAAR